MNDSVFYLIGDIVSFLTLLLNVFLLFLNRRTLKEVKRQNNRIEHSLESDTINKIVVSQQTILLNLLSNKKDNDNLIQSFGGSDVIYGTLMINHFNMVYTFFKKGFLDIDSWIGLQNDIRDCFKNIYCIKIRWNQVRSTFSKEFQDFIDSLVEKGRLV